MERSKILIVEDENIVAEDTKDILQRFNYFVIGIASSGKKEGRMSSTGRMPDYMGGLE